MRRPRLPMETKNEIMLLAAQLHHIVEEQKAAGRAGGRVQLLAALVAEAAEGAYVLRHLAMRHPPTTLPHSLPWFPSFARTQPN